MSRARPNNYLAPLCAAVLALLAFPAITHSSILKDLKGAWTDVKTGVGDTENAAAAVAKLTEIVAAENRSSVHGAFVATQGGATWMSALPDDRTLAQLTIPGTHDSGTGEMHLTPVAAKNVPSICYDKLCVPKTAIADVIGTNKNIGALVEAQYWTIEQQLNAGIRFFDIRIANYPGGGAGFALWHGVWPVPLGDFDRDAMAAVNTFLAAHPKEAVFMSVKNDDTVNKSAFVGSVVQSAANHFLLNASPSTKLKDMRGHVVFFNRLDSSSGGIYWSSGFMQEEDQYQNPFSCSGGKCDSGEGAKTGYITAALNAARSDTSGNNIHVIFASAQMDIENEPTGLDIVPNAKNQNGVLNSLFRGGGGTKPCSGAIFPMDYPGYAGGSTHNELISAMIAVNSGSCGK